MSLQLTSLEATNDFAEAFGRRLVGGEIIELIGDVGSGKTSFVKGLALGLGVEDDVQSPSFTLSRVYEGRDGLRLAHYDFYRLADPGIMSYDIAEAVSDPKTVVAVEWAETVTDVLPEVRTTVTLSYGAASEEREVTVNSSHKELQELYETWH